MLEGQRLQVSDQGEISVVRFADQAVLDDLAIQEMGQELSQIIEAEGRTKIVLDFSSVRFVSSAALGKLIVLNKQVKARGGSLKICGIRPEVYEVFAVTKLDGLFDLEKSEADTLAAL